MESGKERELSTRTFSTDIETIDKDGKRGVIKGVTVIVFDDEGTVEKEPVRENFFKDPPTLTDEERESLFVERWKYDDTIDYEGLLFEYNRLISQGLNKEAYNVVNKYGGILNVHINRIHQAEKTKAKK